MQHGEFSSLVQLEHRSAAEEPGSIQDHVAAKSAYVAAVRCSAVKTSRLVPKQVSVWSVPVRTPGEGVEDGLFAAWIHLEHHSASGLEGACAYAYVAAAVVVP